MFNSDYFHRLSKNHEEGRESISSNSDEWPIEWKTLAYKTYPHFPHIVLSKPPLKEIDIFDVIARRHSTREFQKHSPFSLEELSALLLYSCGLQPKNKIEGGSGGLSEDQHRAQPSGGGRFAIETYFLNFVEGEIPAGVFHYNVKYHQLEVLQKRTFTRTDISGLFGYPYIQEATGVLVLTAVFGRNQIKYGERGYRYMLLEAGHIGQNISLVSRAVGLKSVMMGGSVDGAIEKLLDIDGVTESLVYTCVVGR